ncbi:MAG: AbrB/MazE/SpoVT family DNA-binding domain-containing protein [Terracidiphilus sp.]
MSTIIEIDRAGRIVIPKKMRDALHLSAGTRLLVGVSGGWLSLKPAGGEAQLIVEDGTPLIFPADGKNAPLLTAEMVNESIAQGRIERERRILGAETAEDAD